MVFMKTLRFSSKFSFNIWTSERERERVCTEVNLWKTIKKKDCIGRTIYKFKSYIILVLVNKIHFTHFVNTSQSNKSNALFGSLWELILRLEFNSGKHDIILI